LKTNERFEAFESPENAGKDNPSRVRGVTVDELKKMNITPIIDRHHYSDVLKKKETIFVPSYFKENDNK